MKRLFLLIAVCMIGMVNALAQSESNAPIGFTVVPPEESGTGSYVLTFKKAAADGETLHSWNEVVEGGSLDFLRSASSISIVSESGCQLTQTDVTNIIGDYYPGTFFPSLVTLDMGDAVLGDDSYLGVMAAKSITGLKTFVFPKTTENIPTGMFIRNNTIEEIIMLDPDDLENDPHIEVIPTDAFKGCTQLSVVRLPNGLEEIGSGAFDNCAFESISLPNTLTTIGANAFEYCTNLKSITIPYSVTSIGNSAFQHNDTMTDVYVLGNNVTIGNGAFNENQTYNFTYHEDGSVDFTDWDADNSGGTVHPLVLHIPNNDEAYANYINPFLRMLQDPLFSDDEFSEKLNNVSDHPDAKIAVDNLKAQYGITSDIADYAIFSKDHWVTKEDAFGKIKRFFKLPGGLFNKDAEVKNNIYGGWRNFMLAEGDVKKKTWPDTRMVDSRWYSAVFPFDLSFNQVESAYGANTDAREFTNVWEHTVDGKLTRTVRFNTKPNIPSATSAGSSVDKNKTGYIKAGRPYMIHPGTRVEVIEIIENEEVKEKYGRTIAGVNVDEAEAIIADNSDAVLETVERSLVYDEAGNNIGSQKYYFKGTFKTQDMLPNTFYLGYDPEDPETWPLAFYVSRTGGTNKWSAFTSVVRKTDGSSIENAKPMGLDFTLIIPEEEFFGITTGIESVADKKSVNNGVVYNLNGQVIGNQSTSNLSKGIYIVNGKKIVVR